MGDPLDATGELGPLGVAESGLDRRSEVRQRHHTGGGEHEEDDQESHWASEPNHDGAIRWHAPAPVASHGETSNGAPSGAVGRWVPGRVMARSDVVVAWFRRDLRLSDNPALADAVGAAEHVVPLFVHDPVLRRHAGPARQAHLLACLAELDRALDGGLVQRCGRPATVVRDVAQEVEADAVYVAEDFGPYGVLRDAQVESSLDADGRRLERVGSPYAVPPATVLTVSASPYRVFTPFSRAWRAHGWADPVARPTRLSVIGGVSSDAVPDAPPVDADLPDAGEAAAHRRLDRFLAGPIEDYATDRDRPDRPGTSHLSVDLKYGTIHPRQVLARLGRGEGPHTFETELCWRDFYADVLHHRPDSAWQEYDRSMSSIHWDTGRRADDRFDAWAHGQTGYPIVDAGMRQLLATGWMHNRLRMVTASFLVKDLHLDWRRGARWFLDHLVDGDLASNNHGWQWVAGCGTDAAPFFRVFNPTTQGRRFDPDGDYVRRWVPELAGVDGRAVHEPWKAAGDDTLFDGPTSRYPDRIVDHAHEREEALARYQRR